MDAGASGEASTSSNGRLLSASSQLPRTRTGSVGTTQTTRTFCTARSTRSAPLLPSTLQQHEFPLREGEIGTRKLEGAHVGAGSLRRVFIGPHFVGQGGGKGKEREREQQGMDEEEGSSGESSDSSDEDDDDEEDARDWEGRAERARRRIARGRRKGQRVPTGETVHGGFKATGSRKSSMHKWIGGSFEVGGDVREAQARRDQAAQQRKASAPTPSQLGSLANDQTFTTARSKLEGTKEEYQLIQPHSSAEAKLPPGLIHGLLRRPSDVPFNDTTSLSAAPIAQNSTPTPVAPKGILRTKGPQLNGSLLGRGHPGSPSLAPPASLRSLPLPMPPPIPNASKSTPPSGTVTFSQAKPLEGDKPPVPASEVLARPDAVDEDVPLAAFPPRKRKSKNDILRKERMLMRVDWSAREDLPDHFDENTSRKFPTKHEGWEELGVVWRRHHIELWTEPAIHATSFLLGRKKLKHTIPLHPNRTKLSLYSSPDSIFCLTHRPSSHHNDSPSTSSAKSKRASRKKASGDERADDEGEEEEDNGGRSKATKRAYVHFRHSGTNIYIFRPKTTSVSKEWMWHLFRALGGSLPKQLDIAVPGLGARIRLPVPVDLPAKPSAGEGYLPMEEREGEGWRLLTPSAVIAACVERLRCFPEWEKLFQEAQQAGREVRLVWRRGRVLDWVEMGKREREWGVVAGLAMQQPHFEPRLELRLALHYPTTVRLPSTPTSPSIRLSEPPSIEGYLTRHRPKSGNERIYLSSHDGHLFLCRPTTAHPPEPPMPVHEGVENPAALVLAPFVLGFASVGAGEKEKKKKRERLLDRIGVSRIGGGVGKEARRKERTVKSFEKGQGSSGGEEGGGEDEDEENILAILEREEKKRAFQQISDARGYVDLRDVVSVEVGVDEGEIDAAVGIFDVGGTEGLEVVEDKGLLSRQRSFVVTTRGGTSVRFECYSIAVREEWVGRLRALVTYWSRRERMDAIEQMELSSFGPRRQLPTDSHPNSRDPSPAREEETAETASLLSKVCNFCIMEECRPIVRCGRFFVKKGLRGMFKERYLILLAGTLVEFQVHERDMHGAPLPSVYHRRKSSLSLRGCYVYSGRLTASFLNPNTASTWDPADPHGKFPRMYRQDGLRVADEEEDCTLVILKRPFGGGGRFGKQGSSRVLRARSMVERDEMVFALNQAIQRLAEGERAREDRLKEFPWLKSTS
ncbi:hypothetical protein BCR35DRAFT_308380 [Leucosporidium creatinivorum]|uniref:PH domain-containing protein n=1 Tax=Leucosporidium creatinivorum TaxID=106004 RepID=A0A1Y2E5W0_9BASI|nr:hypothetical protein BCR35DRAFT_308380 [Leucosporidium creatinivorum]